MILKRFRSGVPFDDREVGIVHGAPSGCGNELLHTALAARALDQVRPPEQPHSLGIPRRTLTFMIGRVIGNLTLTANANLRPLLRSIGHPSLS